MNSFELTERGKIVIAVVIVIILLVIPLVIILGISSCSDSSGATPPDSDASSLPPQLPVQDESPVISDTPLPSHSGSDTPDSTTQEPAATPDSTAVSEPTVAPEPTASPEPSPGDDDANGDGNGDEYVEYGTVGLNIAEGQMQVIFSPMAQKALDEETVSMLEDFLSSPKNTRGSQVKVEMPNLSDEDEAIFTSAVKEAFATYNIDESRLLFVSSGSKSSEPRFEVAFSFTSISNQK